MSDELHLWLNIAVVLAIVGAVVFLSCRGSTTWRD